MMDWDDRHEDTCEVVLSGNTGELARWVSSNAWWEGDQAVCTCRLRDVIARRDVYGDERLIAELPFSETCGPSPQEAR